MECGEENWLVDIRFRSERTVTIWIIAALNCRILSAKDQVY